MATTKKAPAKKAAPKAAVTGKIDVSVIVPLYNEEESVPHLLKRIADVMRKHKWTWELICVDDGSKDTTAQVLDKSRKDYPELVPVYFRRNYGQTAAMQAGLDHARGDVMVTMDGDLQNDPNDIPRLMERIKHVDVVSGWRKDRKDNTFMRTIPSRIANRLISSVTGVELHDYGCSLKAYRREVIENVRLYGELHRFIPALVSQYGATIEEMVVTHHAREHGVSKYGISRTFRVILDLLAVKFFLKYLHRPMHAFGMVGLSCLTPGVLICLYLTLLKIFTGAEIGSRPLLMMGVMLILIGVQLLGMGILGELLVRIYHEPLGRKQYILRDGPKRR
ncbi:MAG: glycosyltransferase [Proteobacteria bacterium]|nr:glycosyltransferase [Pseudomonadota bacterium]